MSAYYNEICSIPNAMMEYRSILNNTQTKQVGIAKNTFSGQRSGCEMIISRYVDNLRYRQREASKNAFMMIYFNA